MLGITSSTRSNVYECFNFVALGDNRSQARYYDTPALSDSTNCYSFVLINCSYVCLKKREYIRRVIQTPLTDSQPTATISALSLTTRPILRLTTSTSTA